MILLRLLELPIAQKASQSFGWSLTEIQWWNRWMRERSLVSMRQSGTHFVSLKQSMMGLLDKDRSGKKRKEKQQQKKREKQRCKKRGSDRRLRQKGLTVNCLFAPQTSFLDSARNQKHRPRNKSIPLTSNLMQETLLNLMMMMI